MGQAASRNIHPRVPAFLPWEFQAAVTLISLAK
jgi:hypothetical protein